MCACLSSGKYKKSFSLQPKVVEYIVFLAKKNKLNESQTLEKIVEDHKKQKLVEELKVGYQANNKQNKKTNLLFSETFYDSFK